MRLSIFIASILLFSSSLFAQKTPVKWTMNIEETEKTQIVEVVLTANIEDTWHIYSRETEEDGPIPTELIFESSDDFELIGTYSESKKPHTEFSDLFEINVSSFSDEVQLIQKVKILNPTGKIDATVRFMCCSGNQCLPPNDVRMSADF